MSLQADSATGTLTLALSSPVEARVFRLTHPQRLVVDLPRTRRAAALPAIPREGIVAGLRASERRVGERRDLRLVIALKGAVAYRLQWRRGGAPQLCIEFSRRAVGSRPSRPSAVRREGLRQTVSGRRMRREASAT